MPSATAAGDAGRAGLPPLSHPGLPLTTSPTSSATRATARTTISRPPAPWWWSPPPAPAAARWPPASASSTTSTSRGITAGYAKFETFPIWNLPLKHPVNLAYEAATADLDDVNMIDPFHLEAYGETTVNYNRDVEVFPGPALLCLRTSPASCPYQSPTDMGVNMAGNCIIDDDACRRGRPSGDRPALLRRALLTAGRAGAATTTRSINWSC